MTGGPTVAVAAVVVDGDDIVLVRRSRPPNEGCWALPGGRVETGETLAEALVREVAEETGLEGLCGELMAVSEVIHEDFHAVVVVHRMTLLARADVVAGDDAAEARWVPLGDVAELRLVDGLAELLHEHDVIATIT